GGRETHREARRLGTGPLLIAARGGGCWERPAGGAGGRGFAQSAPAEEGVPRGIAGRAGPFDPRGGGSPADRRAGQGGRLRAGGGGAPAAGGPAGRPVDGPSRGAGGGGRGVAARGPHREPP